MRKNRSRTRQLGSIERELLDELSFGDLLYGMLLSGRSTRRMFRLARERANYHYRRKLAVDRLIALDFIEKQGEKLRISSEGRGALGIAIQNARASLASRSWDHKWRIVAFDIPEQFAELRNKVRGFLKQSGFRHLQHSLWIFPHECDELVALIKNESRLSKYILYGTMDRIENGQHLKKLFRL